MPGDRRKSTRKPESARGQEVKGNTDKGQPNEYEHLREEINKTWTGWSDSNSTTSDIWRRIEQSGLDNALKKLAATKPELEIISGLSSDEADNVATVMTEFCDLLNAIRVSFVDNEKDIFDSDEREKRYLTVSCPSIINIWNSYCTFASNYATAFVNKGWLNSSEHKTLLSVLNELVASSVKLIVLSVNMADYHSLDDTDALVKEAIQDSTNIAKDTEVFLSNYVSLGEKHTAGDEMLEILGWMLNGLYHIANKVIKLAIEAKEPGGSLEDYDCFIDSLISLTAALQALNGGEQPKEETQQQQQQQQQTEKSADKKVSNKDKNNKKKSSKSEPSKESKPEPQQKESEDSKSKDSCLDVIQKYSAAYKQFSDDAWNNKRSPSIKGLSGVELKYRTENYDQLGKIKVDACEATKRKQWLDDLNLTDCQVLHSDIFIISPSPLSCTQEVTIQFPLHTKGDNIYLRMKCDGVWKDVENPEIITDEDNRCFITFNTTSCEAFTALTASKSDFVTVPEQGYNYVNKENGKIEIAFPQGCFDKEVEVNISVMEFDQQNKTDSFVGIVCASDAIKLACKEQGVKMNKNVTVQLPITDDEDDKDTELVVARCNDKDVQVLDKRQYTIKESGNGLYCVDLRGFWCVAILRIKRIFLNMRETIKREFQGGYGLKHPCSIITFIDDETRGEEKQTFVMEVIDKMEADDVVESKRELGLIEVKRSRSKDVLLQRGDQVRLVIDGQMRGTEAVTEQDLTLCYMYGCSNVILVDTEIKRDPDKLPDAMLFYKHPDSESSLHSVAIMTRDLSELPTDEITARNSTTAIKTDSKKSKDLEEAAIQLLKMESLMSLARELTADEGRQLGVQLGVKPEVIKQIQELLENDHVGANFRILCEWRGRSARATMADFLVSSLKSVGKLRLAEIVTEVRKYCRCLEKTDFQTTKGRQRNSPA